jgi:hypothetical protein
MKIYLVFLFLITSCAYPDIDSVPDFANLNITKKEANDICNIIYENKVDELLECLAPNIDKIPDFSNLNFTEDNSIKLCKLINTDKKDLLECLVTFYESQEH